MSAIAVHGGRVRYLMSQGSHDEVLIATWGMKTNRCNTRPEDSQHIGSPLLYPINKCRED